MRVHHIRLVLLIGLALLLPFNFLVQISNNWMKETNRQGWEVIAKQQECVLEIYTTGNNAATNCVEAVVRSAQWEHRQANPPFYVLLSHKLLRTRYPGGEITW